MILERNISKFQSLNNISTFKLFVSFSTPTDSATPYFSVQMVGNNHGSRVDVVVELRDPKVTSDELSVFDRFIYETVLFNTFSFPNMHQLRKISEFTESLLWIQSELKQKEKLNFTLGLESKFTNVADYQISSLKLKEAIQLSTHNPAHCVSVSGLISSGYLSEGHQGNWGLNQNHSVSCLQFAVNQLSVQKFLPVKFCFWDFVLRVVLPTVFKVYISIKNSLHSTFTVCALCDCGSFGHNANSEFRSGIKLHGNCTRTAIFTKIVVYDRSQQIYSRERTSKMITRNVKSSTFLHILFQHRASPVTHVHWNFIGFLTIMENIMISSWTKLLVIATIEMFHLVTTVGTVSTTAAKKTRPKCNSVDNTLQSFQKIMLSTAGQANTSNFHGLKHSMCVWKQEALFLFQEQGKSCMNWYLCWNYHHTLVMNTHGWKIP